MITVNFDLIDSSANEIFSRLIITPASGPIVYNSQVVTNDDITAIERGSIVSVPLVPNAYTVRLIGINTTSEFYINLPSSIDNTTVNVKDYIVLNFPSSSLNLGISLTSYAQVTNINPYSSSYVQMKYVNGFLKSVDYYEHILVASGSSSYRSLFNPSGTVNFYNLNLTSVIGHNCPSMTSLDCSQNLQLQTMDISGSTKLSNFICVNIENTSSLTNLDLSTCKALSNCFCNGNHLTTLLLPTSCSLTRVDCYNNMLDSLVLPTTSLLNQLNCFGNNLTALDVSANTDLQILSCNDNLLTTLDVSHNVNLNSLNCYDNQLTSLDVSNSPLMNYLDCHSNPLTSLNISGSSLNTLICNSCNLTALDVSADAILNTLNCSSNNLTTSSVDNILNALLINGDVGMVDLSGTGNASPSADGYATASLLTAAGWSVTTN